MPKTIVMPDFPTARILGFIGRFVLVYALLIIPWPGWHAAYDNYFCSLGRTVFVAEDEKRLLTFESNHGPYQALDTSIVITNRELINSQSQAHVITLSLDAWGIGWIPTALTTALILATAIPWRRRLWSLFWGLFWVHLFILFSVWIHIWFNSEQISLVKFSGFWRPVVEGLDYTLITQIGISFSAPVLIWVLVTFRRKDLPGREPS